MMLTVQILSDFLESFAPARLAEDWDNVGLLVGDGSSSVQRVMTCLTVTPESVDEAVQRKANLIVTHHPLPFHPLKRITSDTVAGRMLLQLAEHRIAVYSPHTAFDSAATGINQQLAEGLDLLDIAPLVAFEDDPESLGSGRWGRWHAAKPLGKVADAVMKFLGIQSLQIVGTPSQPIQRVAVACGSAGQFLTHALRVGCDALVTGETSFHTCLEAEAAQLALILPGHYASERFAVETLAHVLAEEFPQLDVWASERETDPLKWFASQH